MNHSKHTPFFGTIAFLLCALILFVIGCGKQEVPEPKETTPATKAETKASDTAPSSSTPADTVPSTSPAQTEPEETEKETLPPETAPAETVWEPTPTEALGFLADLSAYEEYMDPTGEKRDAFLLLVNPDHPLTRDFVPQELTDLKATRKDGRGTQKMALYAAKALEALFLDAEANGMVNDRTGYRLSVTSAYRSYSSQDSIFNTYLAQALEKHPDWSVSRAEADVMTYSCRPGTSEHQTGLCCDMHNQVSASSSHPERYTEAPEMQWLMENSWKYGFILRFPADKEPVTGIKFEPWHFRFVGRFHAERMKELGMCLEEYTEYMAKDASEG